MRQERISRTDRARQVRRSRRRCEQAALGHDTPRDRAGARAGGAGPDADEDLLRRISMLIDQASSDS